MVYIYKINLTGLPVIAIEDLFDEDECLSDKFLDFLYRQSQTYMNYDDYIASTHGSLFEARPMQELMVLGPINSYRILSATGPHDSRTILYDFMGMVGG